MKKLLVTGATGFLGSRITFALADQDRSLVSAVRRIPKITAMPNVGFYVVRNVDSETEWLPILHTVDCIIHTAARVHVVKERMADPLTAYRAVNVGGTRRLAEHAASSGVRRFIFLSSIGVNGVFTDVFSRNLADPRDERAPIKHGDHPDPREPYGISKWEAEQALWDISAKTGLEVVVLRPPLVYGPGVKGNLARLLKLVRLGLPLPFGALQNKRSLIGLDNLVDLLICCVDHPAAAGQTFLVSDGEDLSTPDLLRHMATAMGRSARLFPVPVSLLRLAGSALGKRAEIDRLVGSLQIDSSHTCRVLGWTPPVSVQEGIRRMVQGA